ncbi:hypothetical protein DEO72_LG9g1747 [Vigna unguiculata]|uniref:Uncharacterized protein n=1 Tax=Vigna unguiculata TaxID=3917 RepID=A0A4D6MZ05_VIGUN|nr:hypothetical protein DEO72_LG9g1747 [Vigna unguiculata]
MLKRINHNSYTIPFIKVIQLIFLKENFKASHLLAQLLAQAAGSRPGEEDPRSGELPSPRQELDFQYRDFTRVLAQARLSSPKRDVARSKFQWVAWATLRAKNT